MHTEQCLTTLTLSVGTSFYQISLLGSLKSTHLAKFILVDMKSRFALLYSVNTITGLLHVRDAVMYGRYKGECLPTWKLLILHAIGGVPGTMEQCLKECESEFKR